MNSSTFRRMGAHRSRLIAFTLIELLTVMAIIVILAGIVIGIVGYAQNKAGRARTTAEIKDLETAINAYQGDMGAVPRSADSDKLNAKADPGTPSAYTASSLNLYKALCGYYYATADANGNVTFAVWNRSSAGLGTMPADPPKQYKVFAPSQLNGGSATLTNGNVAPASVTSLTDPFGGNYGYSTIYLKEKEAAPNDTKPPADGYNPTFDLWSTGGYGGSGRSYPSDITTPAQRAVLWITNWNQ